MKYFADLHIHSKYSRATARNLDLETIYLSSQIKGLNLVATGDFTHPAWFDEIYNKLEPDHSGLFDLRSEIKSEVEKRIPAFCKRSVKFILCTEISNIYKKEGKTRKNHNLVFFPSLSSVRKFNAQLSKIGNLESDGRPIVGLDSRDLLEIVLETDIDGFLIPAHIWTPWFSLLGSKSGFDSVEQCFGDLADQIFALETGLSSDPEMNWRVSGLDKFFLISNSDAHSPSKLAREANIFETDLSYYSLLEGLKNKNNDAFKGTLEFFPEEGKYHIDGHRKCGFSCLPQEALKLNNSCPICGKPLTLGVLHRVEQLSDRQKPFRHSKARPFIRLIQLENVLSEILNVGPTTKKVSLAYNELINDFGSELDILLNVAISELESSRIYLFPEAIRRIRQGKVNFQPGYDGVFGKVSVFSQQERDELIGQRKLFTIDSDHKSQHDLKEGKKIAPQKANVFEDKKAPEFCGPNNQQQKIISHDFGPVLIVAGPGTGKTYTITQRISRLINDKIAEPEKVLVVTFTNKAADELNFRLKSLLKENDKFPIIGTFHSICLKIIEKYENRQVVVIDDNLKADIINRCKKILKQENLTSSLPAHKFSELFSLAKQSIPICHNKSRAIRDKTYYRSLFDKYQQVLASQNLFDYDDLIIYVVKQLRANSGFYKNAADQFNFIFVDEYQDINSAQYQLIKLLGAESGNICAIGDPDQSIYGFRGSDVSFFKNFTRDYPKATLYRLSRNYRSTKQIVSAACALIGNNGFRISEKDYPDIYSTENGKTKVTVLKVSSEKAEAIAVGKLIEEFIGGSGFHSIDFEKFDYTKSKNLSFKDFAVLFRTAKQIKIFEHIFSKAGIPYQVAKNGNLMQDTEISKIISILRILGNCFTFSDIEIFKRAFALKLSAAILDSFFEWIIKNNISLDMAFSIIEKIPLNILSVAKQRDLFLFCEQIKKIKDILSDKSIVYIIDYLVSILDFHDSEDVKQKISFLKNCSHFHGDDLKAYLSKLALCQDYDILSHNAEKVSLLTMHSSKGLEFPIVFIAGCEDGLIPYSRSSERDVQDNEERRLFYVAMTRAKQELYITYSEKRKIYGELKETAPSPFLKDIFNHIDYHEIKPSRKKKIKKSRQLSLFD